MSITGDKYPFTEKNIAASPDKAGVYALYDDNETIYIGRAVGGSTTIRTRLASHKAGHDGRCTQGASHYKREVTANAAAREVELLKEYKRLNGRLPRCNDRIG